MDTLHIGEKIKEVFDKRGVTKTELARRLGHMSATNVHKIFKRETIDTGLLQQIGEALEYDFFQLYYKSTPVGKKADDVPTEIARLRANIDKLVMEVDYLKEVNALIKETNAILKKKQ